MRMRNLEAAMSVITCRGCVRSYGIHRIGQLWEFTMGIWVWGPEAKASWGKTKGR